MEGRPKIRTRAQSTTRLSYLKTDNTLPRASLRRRKSAPVLLLNTLSLLLEKVDVIFIDDEDDALLNALPVDAASLKEVQNLKTQKENYTLTNIGHDSDASPKSPTIAPRKKRKSSQEKASEKISTCEKKYCE